MRLCSINLRLSFTSYAENFLQPEVNVLRGLMISLIESKHMKCQDE